jgi:hypothetical protein
MGTSSALSSASIITISRLGCGACMVDRDALYACDACGCVCVCVCGVPFSSEVLTRVEMNAFLRSTINSFLSFEESFSGFPLSLSSSNLYTTHTRKRRKRHMHTRKRQVLERSGDNESYIPFDVFVLLGFFGLRRGRCFCDGRHRSFFL